MKKLALSIVTLMFSVSMLAGNGDDIKVYFCDNTVETVDEQQLLLCNELVLNSNEWKIKSLSIMFAVGKDVIEYAVKGNKLPKEFIEKIKKVSPEMMYIEKIILVNNKGEEMRLEAQKLIITE